MSYNGSSSNAFESAAFTPFADLLLTRTEFNWETIYALLNRQFVERVVAKEQIVGGRTGVITVLNAMRAMKGYEGGEYEVTFWCWKLKAAVDKQM